METPPPSPHDDSPPPSPDSPIIDLGFDLGIDILLDGEVADIWDGVEYIPLSPPDTSPESTPPPRYLSPPVIEDVEEEELDIVDALELNTSTASEPTDGTYPARRRRYFSI